MSISSAARLAAESLVRAILDRANQHDPQAWRAYMAPGMTFVNPVTGTGGADEMVNFHTAVYEAFPDMHYAIRHVLATDEVAIAECRITATHRGEFMGAAATGRVIDLPAVFVSEVADGHLSHWRAYFDVATMLRQLGLSS